MAKRFLVLQHATWNGPGRFLQQAARHLKVELVPVRVWRQSIPDLAAHDGLIVTGTRLDAAQQPAAGSEAELAAIRQAIADDRPYLGLGLGHELLAVSQGARVGRNYCASIGFVVGHLTAAGREHPVCRHLPSRIPLFKWHERAVLEPLPKNLSLLATSVECQVEAISIPGRPHVLGIQFVNHAAAVDDVERYWQHDAAWIHSLNGKYVNPVEMVALAKKLERQMAHQFEVFFRNFVNLC